MINMENVNYPPSRSSGAVVVAMGSTMILVLMALAGLASAQLDALNELRSNFEFQDIYSTNLDDPKYRLLDNVQPNWVYVDLDVFLSESRFTGTVRHEVTISGEPLSQIVLHQGVTITGVNLADAAGNPLPLQVGNAFETDDYFEILKINPAVPIPAGDYIISISFNGEIFENQYERGFYKGYYFLGNEKHEYATTQFQPYYARKAFPCFDEPQFKSRFVISITRDSELSKSYSNMAIASYATVSEGRIRETFYPTPTISAYLIAFHVSDFVETVTGTDERPLGIVSRPGVTEHHDYAHEIGMKITDDMNEYFDYDYYGMGQGTPMKNDHIAIPDFPAGAMENWGMVNYREAYLLYDKDNTNINNKIFIATIMAHELAHKWFGNLVTCFWWSNLWLNESFASFFEYFSTDRADPELELADQFVTGYVHSALNWDAGANATPMNLSTVANNPSISGHFSTTSYAKGASVLRMMEHFVGPNTFRTALRTYLRDNAYQLGTPEDMYAAFRSAVNADPTFAQLYEGIDIGDVMDSWIQTPGSPVLNVEVDTSAGEIKIEQKRFQLTGTPHTMRWQLPYSWTHGGAPDFNSIKPTGVLTEASATIELPANAEDNWVIFNIQQSGLYRVNYDKANWEKLAAALRVNKNTFHKLNRAQIVNDVLHFIRSGDISIPLAFDVLSFLADEDDYYVWAGALGQLDIIRSRLQHIETAYDEFNAYLLELMATAIKSLGYEQREDDSTSVILNRMQILNYACNLGHDGCIADSLQKWNTFKANTSNLVPVNARRYVYCIGLRNGDQSDYNLLLNQYDTSENAADMVVILRALACTKDQELIADYLDQSLTNEKIRYHDRTNAFAYALQGNRENLHTVIEFVKSKFAEMRTAYGGVDRFNVAINSLAGFLTDFDDIDDFHAWAYDNQVALGSSFVNAQNVVSTAMNNIDWGNQVAVDIFATLRARSSASAFSAPLALLLSAVLVQFIR